MFLAGLPGPEMVAVMFHPRGPGQVSSLSSTVTARPAQVTITNKLMSLATRQV